MNQSNVHLLDLPNEVLLIILKKLDNIDVLYSFFGINNERLDTLVKDGIFNNILNLVKTSSIPDNKLDQFCTYILPRNHNYIKKLILDSTSIESILLAGDYPNLTSLELFNFGYEIVFHYFTGKCITYSRVIKMRKHWNYIIIFCLDDSTFRHIFQNQITDLILHNDDEYAIKNR